MSTRSRLSHNLAISFAILFTLCCFATAMAQSGRRAPKSTNPAAAPKPEATPEPTISIAKPKPAVRFILGMDQNGSFTSMSLGTMSGVKRTCGHRLGEPEWATVEMTTRPMLRSDAINRAKAEKDAYVVWLQIRPDTMSSRQTGTPNNAYIEYTVFGPGNAKVITSGGTYPGRGNTNVILSPKPTGIEGDYYMNRAARDLADRILAKFKSHVR